MPGDFGFVALIIPARSRLCSLGTATEQHALGKKLSLYLTRVYQRQQSAANFGGRSNDAFAVCERSE